jgi:hypothetical protein
MSVSHDYQVGDEKIVSASPFFVKKQIRTQKKPHAPLITEIYGLSQKAQSLGVSVDTAPRKVLIQSHRNYKTE